MVYTFARVGAAVKMRVEDVYIQGRRTWVRLHEKGGKRHEMPCHHSLEQYLTRVTPVWPDPRRRLLSHTRRLHRLDSAATGRA